MSPYLRKLGAVVLFFALGLLSVATAHHHDSPDRGSGNCVICGALQAHAVVVGDLVAPPPAPRSNSVPVFAPTRLESVFPSDIASRGPPACRSI